MTSVVVLGSIFMDVAASTPRRPGPGETVIGTDLVIGPGGKGFNQAAAASAAGARSCLISRLGDDLFGRELLAACMEAGVDTAHVAVDPVEGTGVGLPLIDADGENAIVVVPRAAGLLSPGDVARAEELISGADMLLAQLEVPLAATIAAAETARRADVPVLLNAAPADAVPEALLALVDHLVVNEHEAALLGGLAAVDPDAAPTVAASLRRHFDLRSVVVTLGGHGAAYADALGTHRLAGHEVPVVDTVGSGDAFCGYLAAVLAAGGELSEAVRQANAAGALTVTRLGAQAAIPSAVDVARLLTASISSPMSTEGSA